MNILRSKKIDELEQLLNIVVDEYLNTENTLHIEQKHKEEIQAKRSNNRKKLNNN